MNSSGDWPRKSQLQLSLSGLRPDPPPAAMWNSNQSDSDSDLGESADVGDEEFYEGGVVTYDGTDYDDVYDTDVVYDEYGEYLEGEKESYAEESRLGSFEPPVATSSPRIMDDYAVATSSEQSAALSG